MASKKHALAKQREEMTPLERAEEMRIQLGLRIDERLKMVRDAVGDKELNEALYAALATHRQYVAFSHEMFLITGRTIYEDRSRLEDKLGSDFLRQRARALKRESMPVKFPARNILNELRASWPKPPLTRFEGEHEYQAWLKEQGLVESDRSEYESRTNKGEQTFPSRD